MKHELIYYFNKTYFHSINILTIMDNNRPVFEIRLKKTSNRIILVDFCEDKIMTRDTNIRLKMGENKIVFMEDDQFVLHKINNWVIDKKIECKDILVIEHETDKNYWK